MGVISKMFSKTKGKPFYKQGVFWFFVIAVIVLLILIIGKIESERRLAEEVKRMFYESGEGGTPITEIADDFEKQMESYYK